MKRFLRCLPIALLALLVLCLITAGLLALDGRNYYPAQQDMNDRLDGVQAGYLEEVFHLKATFGDATWPGFGRADFPMLVGNDSQIFLVGAADAPEGWEALPASIINNQPVFRRPAGSLGGKLQAFVTPLDGRWLPSFYTYPASSGSLVKGLIEPLPSPLPTFFPYRLFLNFFFPPQMYILGWEHEAFHAYQALEAPQRFDAIQSDYKAAKSYPVTDSAFNTAWEREINLLIQSVQEKSDQRSRDLAAQFLDQRSQRRQQFALSPDMVQFERGAEWLEGLAKYTEMTIGRLASQAPGYAPAEGVGFKNYALMSGRYNQQITEVRNHIDDSQDGKFYYTGFLQALLLDRFQPGWKAGFLSSDTWLEDRLSESIR